MKIDLTGKAALVGASSGGLGLASAIRLAQCGASVVLMARHEEKLKASLSSLPVNATGQQHKYLVLDFADYSPFKPIIRHFFKHHTVDILVNNTNRPVPTAAADAKIDDYQTAFDLFFKTVVETTMLAVPNMVKNGFGRIIANLVLSNSVWSATAAWAKTLSNELGPHGITVNNILTGNFDTQRIEKLIAEQAALNGMSIGAIRDRDPISGLPFKDLKFTNNTDEVY